MSMTISHEATSLPALMQYIASRFIEILDAASSLARMAPPGLPPHDPALIWQNTLFGGTLLRRAHVELFNNPGQFAVVHVCLLPHLDDPSPIFGFDMIGGHAQATGIFLDFSPTVTGAQDFALADLVTPLVRARFSHHRAPPEWGTIFSNDFFAIRPGSPDEIDDAARIAEHALAYYLERLASTPRDRAGCALTGQAGYANAQRQNPHTQKMLARHVGPQAASAFVHDTLFPLPA